jgi:hypothetical protein
MTILLQNPPPHYEGSYTEDGRRVVFCDRQPIYNGKYFMWLQDPLTGESERVLLHPAVLTSAPPHPLTLFALPPVVTRERVTRRHFRQTCAAVDAIQLSLWSTAA